MGTKGDTKGGSFHKLSCALTGESELDASLGAELEQRLRSHFATDLQALVEAFGAAGEPRKEDEVLKLLDGSPAYHRVAREIIRVWYTGLIETPYEGVDAPRTPEQWESGLLWKTIKAPAPGFSKNQYGVWGNKPV
jgi:hypothetical protein